MDDEEPVAEQRKGVRRKHKKGSRTGTLRLDRLNFDPNDSCSSVGSDYDWNTKTPLIANGRVARSKKPQPNEQRLRRPSPSPGTVASQQEKAEARNGRRKLRWAKFVGSQSSMDESTDDEEEEDGSRGDPGFFLPRGLSPADDMEISSGEDEDCKDEFPQTNSLRIDRQSPLVGVEDRVEEEEEESKGDSHVPQVAATPSTIEHQDNVLQIHRRRSKKGSTKTKKSSIGSIFVDPRPSSSTPKTAQQKTPRSYGRSSLFGLVDPNTPRDRSSATSKTLSEEKTPLQVRRVQSLPTATTTTLATKSSDLHASNVKVTTQSTYSITSEHEPGSKNNHEATVARKPFSGVTQQHATTSQNSNRRTDAEAICPNPSPQKMHNPTVHQCKPSISRRDTGSGTEQEAVNPTNQINSSSIGLSPILQTPSTRQHPNSRTESSFALDAGKSVIDQSPQNQREAPGVACTRLVDASPNSCNEANKDVTLQEMRPKELVCTPTTKNDPLQTDQLRHKDTRSPQTRQEEDVLCTPTFGERPRKGHIDDSLVKEPAEADVLPTPTTASKSPLLKKGSVPQPQVQSIVATRTTYAGLDGVPQEGASQQPTQVQTDQVPRIGRSIIEMPRKEEFVCTRTTERDHTQRLNEPPSDDSPQKHPEGGALATPEMASDSPRLGHSSLPTPRKQDIVGNDTSTKVAAQRAAQRNTDEPNNDTALVCTPTSEADDIPELELTEDMCDDEMVTTTHVLTITSRRRTPSLGVRAARTPSVGNRLSLPAPVMLHSNTVVRSQGLPVSAPRHIHTAHRPEQPIVPHQRWTAQMAEAAVPGCGLNPVQTFTIRGTTFELPPLPPGWRVAVHNERPYYFHHDFGQSYCCPVALPSTVEATGRRTFHDGALLDSLSRVLLNGGQQEHSRNHDDQGAIATIASQQAYVDEQFSPNRTSGENSNQEKPTVGSDEQTDCDTESGSSVGLQSLDPHRNSTPPLEDHIPDVESVNGSGIVTRASRSATPDVTFGAVTHPEFSSERVSRDPEGERAARQRQNMLFGAVVADKSVTDSGSVAEMSHEASEDDAANIPATDDEESKEPDAPSPQERSDKSSDDKVPGIEKRGSPQGAFSVANQRLFLESPQDEATIASPSIHGQESSPLEGSGTPNEPESQSGAGTPGLSTSESSSSSMPGDRKRFTNMQEEDSVYALPERRTPEGALRIARDALFSGSILPTSENGQPPVMMRSNNDHGASTSQMSPIFEGTSPEDALADVPEDELAEGFEEQNEIDSAKLPRSDHEENEPTGPSFASPGLDPGLPFDEVVATKGTDSVSELHEPGRKPRRTKAKKRKNPPLSLLESSTISVASEQRLPAVSVAPTQHKRHNNKRKEFSNRCYRGKICFFMRLFMPEGQLQYSEVDCPCEECRTGNTAVCQHPSKPRQKKQRRRRVS